MPSIYLHIFLQDDKVMSLLFMIFVIIHNHSNDDKITYIDLIHYILSLVILQHYLILVL